MSLWFYNGLLVTSGGNLVECDYCPCSEPIQCGFCDPGTTPQSFIVEFGGVAPSDDCPGASDFNGVPVVVEYDPEDPCNYLGYIEACGLTFGIYVMNAFAGTGMYVLIQRLSGDFDYAGGSFELYEGDTTQCDDFDYFIPLSAFAADAPYGDWTGASCRIRSLT